MFSVPLRLCVASRAPSRPTAFGLPRTHSVRASTRSGFTLLEMLAATAMVAMLAGSLYATLRIAFRARDTATRTVEMTRKCNATFAFLLDDLQGAAGPDGNLAGAFLGGQAAASGVPANTPGAGSSSSAIGLGGSTTPGLGSAIANSALGGGLGGGTGDLLSFYATATGLEANYSVGDIKKVEYACVSDSGSSDSVLVRRLTTNLLADVLPAPAEETICTGVKSFTMEFFDGSLWETDWDSTTVGDTMPLAVRVTIELSIPGAASGGAGYKMTRVLAIPRGLAVDANVVNGTAAGP
jgi:prepilin-type N-terminal cleavage/methylation domain-containing protein